MWNEFWDWLAHLPQGSAGFIGTLAGSSLGLVALVIGALVNAALNRRRDDRLRTLDRAAVAAVLYAELTGMRRTLVENAEHLETNPPANSGGFVVPEPSTRLLNDSISNLGLLGAEAIRKVMDAYVLIESYHEQLILAGGQLRTDVMPKDRGIVYLPSSSASFVVELNRARASVVEEAMKSLVPFLP